MSLAQLTFGLNNPNADNTVYVSSQASDNNLTLVIGTTVATTFEPASVVVDESQAATVTGSLLYLNLTPLNLTAAEFAAIKPKATGWQIVPFNSEQVLGMTPTSAVGLDPGDTIELEIGALADAGAQGSSASLTVDVYRVDKVTVGNLVFPTHFSVALATPPNAGEELSQDLAVEFLASDVVVTIPDYNTVDNQLTLAFYAGTRGRPVPAGPNTQFVLSFVYANDTLGYGALCTPAQTEPPFAIRAGANAGRWKITPQPGKQSPSWVLVPPSGSPIIGAGPYGSVSILIQNLVTTFQPGPTVALLSYSGIDGYADGTFTLLINKQPHVQITSLTITPNPAVLTDGAAEVLVEWEVQDAGTMTLAPFSQDVTGLTRTKATITRNTPISLTAQGLALPNLGNVALKNATATVLPVINSFVAEPRSIYAGDLPRDVALSWNVNTNEQLQLVSTQGPPDPNQYSAKGTVSKPITGPQMLTLVPLGQDAGNPLVERSLILSAFTTQAASHSVAATYVAAPSNASMVVVSDGSQVSAVDTLAYQSVAAAVPAGSSPAGMVFSADGKTLYVANSGDGTVSVISVAATSAVPQFTFSAQSTVPVGGAPQRLALSPDEQYLYVSIDRGAGAGRLAVVSTGDEPAVVTTLTVGNNPRGVAPLPSGAQLFVANSGSNSVTVIGRSPGGLHSVVGTIPNVAGAADVCVSLDGAVLLVACPAANAVVAIDAAHPEAPRQSLPTGAGAQSVSLMPTGAYAVAGNHGASTVSLIAIGSNPAACRVVANTNITGQPSSVAVTPDAGLVLAGTGSGLAVVTLATYAATDTLAPVGGQPTGVAVSPDNSTVLTWHNALVSISRGTPSTGLSAYDVASQTVTPQLADSAIISFAYHPKASANTAFAVTKGATAVEVYDTTAWTSSVSIPLEGGGQPVALSCSSDGTALFVLTVAADLSAILAVFDLTGAPPYAALGAVKVRNAGGSPGSALTLAVAPDASAAYLTDAGTGNLTLVKRDQHGGYAVSGQPISVGMYPGASALSPDGTMLYVACAGVTNGTLVQVDTSSLDQQVEVLPSNALTELVALVVSPDGSRILAIDQVATGVRVLDAASLRLIQTLSWTTGAEMPSAIAVASDGSQIYAANTVSGNLGVLAQVQGGAIISDVAVEEAVTERGAYRAGAVTADLDAPPYQGLFIRDYVGQTPTSGNTTGAWTTCPDIWASGQVPLPNPDQVLVQQYNTNNPPANTIYVGNAEDNLVYVRGMNTVNGPSTSRVWLYYVNGGGDPSLFLWPNNWMNAGVTQLGNSNPYVEVSSKALNEVDYTYPPFDWKAVPVNGHYCMIAWIEVPPISQPAQNPQDGIGYIGTYNQLAAFVASHPNMGWLNTQDVPTPAGQTWTRAMSFTGPPVGGIFKAGLQFTNTPTDASFSMSIVGPTPALTVTVGKTPVTSPNETYMVPVNWTGYDNFNTTVMVTYYAGATPTPPGSSVQTIAGSNSTGLVGHVHDPLAGAIRARVYPTGRREDGFETQWLTIVGMVQLNLQPA